MTTQTATQPVSSPKKAQSFYVWIAVAAVFAVLASTLAVVAIQNANGPTIAPLAAPSTTTTVAETAPTPDEPQVNVPAPVWHGVDEATDFAALDDIEPLPQPEPDPEPAALGLPASVDLDDNNEATFLVSNTGELDLTVDKIGSDFGSIDFYGVVGTIKGGESAEVQVIVDESILPFGKYTIYVDVETDAGNGVVEIHGEKEFLIIVLDYEVAVTTPFVFVGHGNGMASITVMNFEDFDVTLWVDEDHARITSPDFITLSPGANQLLLPIAPWAVNQFNVMQMQVDLTWIGGNETVTISKMGV